MTLKLIDDAAIIMDYALYLYRYFASCAVSPQDSAYLSRPQGEVCLPRVSCISLHAVRAQLHVSDCERHIAE